MSDRVKRAAGIILAVSALVLCLVPALTANRTREDRYRSGARQQWTLTENGTEANGTVAVNSADAEELTALPGIGETLAAMIVAERDRNGPFRYAEDLLAVRGIGPKTLEKFRRMIDLTPAESGE